jgi:hypothetical protein
MLNRRQLSKLVIGGISLSSSRARAWRRGGSYSASANQFFDRLITPPATAYLYDSLISSLVASGAWALLDVLNVAGAPDSGTSLVNLKQSSFQATITETAGIPTFTPNVGWNGGGSPGQKCIDFHFNPSIAGGNYTQNNAMFFAWQIGGTQANEQIITDTSGGANVELWPKYSNGNTLWAINGDGTEISAAQSADGSGLWVIQRTAANVCVAYNNDVLFQTSSNVSAALINKDLQTNIGTNKIFAWGMGAPLSGSQRTSLFSGLQTIGRGIGAL